MISKKENTASSESKATPVSPNKPTAGLAGTSKPLSGLSSSLAAPRRRLGLSKSALLKKD